jgi:N-methylhydantoinase A
MAFGGAGGLHACRVAEELEVGTVIIPAAAGVLSALGLARADLRRDASRSILAELAQLRNGDLEAAFAELEDDVRASLPGARLRRRADLRYRRQAHELTVDADDAGRIAASFHAAHEQRHGYSMPDEPVELVTVRVTAAVAAPEAHVTSAANGGGRESSRLATFGGERVETAVHSDPLPGATIAGPAIVEYPDSTCVVPPGWTGEVRENRALVLRRPA